MQFVRMHIIAQEVNVHRQARVPKQGQGAPADESQSGSGRNLLPNHLQNRADFKRVHALKPF